MKLLLINGRHQAELIRAIEECYQVWKEQDQKNAEEERSRGWIRCYSQLHLIFEGPLAEIAGAERVSFINGVMGPPAGEEYFFLLSMGPDRRAWLKRILERQGFNRLFQVIEDASEITLPETHSFQDARGDLFEIIGWDESDARRRVEADTRVAQPLTWCGSHLAFPFNGPLWKGRSEEIGEAAEDVAQADVVAAYPAADDDDGPPF